MIIAIYKKKLSPVNDLKFYLEQGTLEVGETLPSIVRFTDKHGVEHECSYDEPFSREAGHIAYVYTQMANGVARVLPTHLDASSIPRADEIGGGDIREAEVVDGGSIDDTRSNS